jgi:predicted GH43/DUF377 family glycosyl hydrolase
MTYTAYGGIGPRIAVAVSRDLIHWRRMGLVDFAPLHGVDLADYDNKDALLFPEPVPAPDGRPALALIHRPDFRTLQQGSRRTSHLPRDLRSGPSMWISYAPLDEIMMRKHVRFGQHHLLAGPQTDWEQLKVGGGAPPLRVAGGWLVVYHGVSGRIVEGIDQQRDARYCAGVLLLDASDPRRVLYRTVESPLEPVEAAERLGIVPNVVFPTGLDLHADNTLDVYYGMADSRIGVARASLAELFPADVARAA